MKKNIEDILKKANYLESIHNFDEAIKLYNDLINSGYKEARIYAFRGYSKFKAGDYHDAIIDFDNAIILKENVPTTYYYRARSKEEVGDVKGALKDYIKSALYDFNKTDVHINIAMIYEYLGDFEKAINEYKIVLKIDTKNTLAIERLKGINLKNYNVK